MIEALLPEGIILKTGAPVIDDDVLFPGELNFIRDAIETRRAEFIGARACARDALGALGVSPCPILGGQDREPVWPAGIVGSITHKEEICAAAVARVEDYRALGIDVEPNTGLEPKVEARISDAAERSAFATLPAERGIAWSRVCFSAKESIYKCYFPLVRRFLGFHDVTLAIDPDAGSFSVTPVAKLQGRELLARFEGRFDCRDGMIVTVAYLPAGT